MKPLVWIIDEEWADYKVEHEILEARYPGCVIRRSTYDYRSDLEEFGHRADLLLCQIYADVPGEVVRRLDNCKGIAVYGGGYDRIDCAAARKKGIGVTNVSDYCKEDLADYVMACVYHFNKRILSYGEAVKAGKWGAQAVERSMHRISGSTMLVIGFGRIGRRVAAKASAAGMRVIAYDPYVDASTMRDADVVKVAWEEGLVQADYVSVNAILNAETTGLLRYGDFRKMKSTAYLINSARGKIIVEGDLIRAVDEGLISGAAVDVIEVEPPMLTEAILRCKGIVVTPHISYISEESFTELKRRTLGNAIEMLEGRIPPDLVN